MAGQTPEQPAPAGDAPAADEPTHIIYTRQELALELRQSEIISNLSQIIYDRATNNTVSIDHSFAVVMTQDCDLLWDYDNRQKGAAGTLSSVLLYAAEPTQEARANVPPGRDIWKRIVQNSDEGYHLLERIPPECDTLGHGIDSLLIDFKNFFTLPPEDVYQQCAAGTAVRRSRLEMPYREHLQCRAAYYFQRVTLPAPHEYDA